jgi:hypothetical protein
MNVKTAVAAALVGLMVVSAGCTRAKPKPNPVPLPGTSGLTMRVIPTKQEYSNGEPVVLHVEITNGQPAACRASRVPEGAVVFVSVTRDGQAVIPGDSVGSPIDGMAAHIRANLVSLAPKASLGFDMIARRELSVDGRHALSTSTLDIGDQAALMFWPVDEPGRYELSARYILPPLPDTPADICRASGDPAKATFVVRGG